MKITFWGATQDVTGSMSVLELPEGNILIDCGLHQGLPEITLLNNLPLPFDASSIKAVILTHAHLDHSGYLPKLFIEGFRGPVYCTHATAKLANIILEDSASLNEMDLYEPKDVTRVTSAIKKLEWNQTLALLGAELTLLPAGHILGASSVKISCHGKTVVFSGDLGRKNDPLIYPPETCPKADVVVMESTYGSKIRQGNIELELAGLLSKVYKESRVCIVASFAVARAQMLLFLIDDFFQKHPDQKFRVVIDSPMMNEANAIYKKFSHLTKASDRISHSIDQFDVIEHQREWDSLKKKSGPLLILSSSGMLSGGRIGRHLLNWQDDPRAILFLPGYQGQGTPGRAFLEGSRIVPGSEGTNMLWQGEVLSSEAFSSHADQSELLEWTKALSRETSIYLIHGETESKKELNEKLKERGFTKVEIPSPSNHFEI